MEMTQLLLLLLLCAALAAGWPSLLPGDTRLEHHGHHDDHGVHSDHGDDQSHAELKSARAEKVVVSSLPAEVTSGAKSVQQPAEHRQAVDVAVETSETAYTGGIPDILVSKEKPTTFVQDPAGGVPDLVLSPEGGSGSSSAGIDYGAGIVLTPARPGHTGHHNPFLPEYHPTSNPSQSSQVIGNRPQPTQRPVYTQKTTQRGPVFVQKPSTQRPFFTHRPSTQRPYFTQKPLTQRPAFAQSPSAGNPFFTSATSRRPLFTQKTTTRRNYFTQTLSTKRPSNHHHHQQQQQSINQQQIRPGNPFLPDGGAGLPSVGRPHSNNGSGAGGGRVTRPTTRRPTTPHLVNTNPLGGPAGAKGPVVGMCPGPASALPCVAENQCDPYTGYVISDGYQLPFPITADTPTVAVVQCLLRRPAGVIGVCCRRLPRPAAAAPAPAATFPERPRPGGTDYGQGLEFVTEKPRQNRPQRPTNIFLPGYASPEGLAPVDIAAELEAEAVVEGSGANTQY